MRLLSRKLTGSPVRSGVSQTPERFAERPAPVLDETMADLIRRFVNSPVKLDLLLYLHDNPYAIDGTDTLALRLGREATLVEACAIELARDGLLVSSPRRAASDAPVYRLTPDPAVCGRIARLAALHARGGAAQIRTMIRDTGTAAATYAAVAGSTRASVLAMTVRCDGGTLSLEGRVNTSAERAELDLICDRLRESRHGIRSVENRVQVEARRLASDTSVRDSVGRALEERASRADEEGTERMRVGIEVIGGVVYLTGLVASPQDRSWCAQRALDVPGVVDVVNWLDVQGQRGR